RTPLFAIPALPPPRPTLFPYTTLFRSSQPSTTRLAILVLEAPPWRGLSRYLPLPPACSYRGMTRCEAACSSEIREAAEGCVERNSGGALPLSAAPIFCHSVTAARGS